MIWKNRKREQEKEMEQECFDRVMNRLNKYPKNVLTAYIANIADLSNGSNDERIIYMCNQEMFNAIENLNQAYKKSIKETA